MLALCIPIFKVISRAIYFPIILINFYVLYHSPPHWAILLWLINPMVFGKGDAYGAPRETGDSHREPANFTRTALEFRIETKSLEIEAVALTPVLLCS